MAFVNQPVEEPDKSLRDYTSPRCEDIKVQESDSKLEATKYEIKSKIIEMVAANPFEGMVTENPYRHIWNFTTICNMVRQEGVPDGWFKWNLFSYSLVDNAKTWYSFASFEVDGNWNKLTKKFCEKFFPISKVQHLRRQVINFMQGEEEGIDQAWDRFNGLIEQGPKLGFTCDVILHTFFFSLTPSCMQHVEMCAGVDVMDKTLTEAAQLLQKVSKAASMRRDWETRLAEEPEYNSRKKKCAEFSKEATRKSQKRNQLRKSLKKNTSSQELPEHRLRRTKWDEQEKHIKREATKGVRTNGLGFDRLRRSIRQEKTVPYSKGNGESIASGFPTGEGSGKFIRP
jgi:hypothetical protein